MDIKVGDSVKLISLSNTDDAWGINEDMKNFVGRIITIEAVLNDGSVNIIEDGGLYYYHVDDLEPVSEDIPVE